MMPILESQLRKCPFWIGRTTPYTNSKANRNWTKWTIRNPAETKKNLFNQYNKHLMSLHHHNLSFDSLRLRYYKSKQSMPRTDAHEGIDLSEKKVNSARHMRLRDNQSIKLFNINVHTPHSEGNLPAWISCYSSLRKKIIWHWWSTTFLTCHWVCPQS